VSTFQERLATRLSVPHSRDCRLCHLPEGGHPGVWVSVTLGAIAGAVVALFVLLGGGW
jgi:hypothetical protein